MHVAFEVFPIAGTVRSRAMLAVPSTPQRTGFTAARLSSKKSINAAFGDVPSWRGAQGACRTTEHPRVGLNPLQLPVEPRDGNPREESTVRLAVRSKVRHVILPAAEHRDATCTEAFHIIDRCVIRHIMLGITVNIRDRRMHSREDRRWIRRIVWNHTDAA